MGQIRRYIQNEKGEWVEDRPRSAQPARPPEREAARAAEPPAKRRRPRGTAVVPSGCAEGALLVALQVAAWALILLSIVGTFYGVQGRDAPILNPLKLIADVRAALPVALLALLGQGLLSLIQWGSRGLARHDWRWWVGYILALALSVWWNWSAYGDPLVALGIPWLVALGVVVAGDVFPELTLVREE